MLNYRLIAKIACKLLALYFFLLSMNYLPNMLVTLISYRNELASYPENILPWFSTGTFILFTAILLWVFADKIAIAIVGAIPEGIASSEVDYNRIVIIAFAISGLFALTKAIPDLVRYIVQYEWQLKTHLNFKETSLYIESLAGIIGKLVQTALGIWLLIGAKGFVRAISSLRNLGLDRIENTKE